MIVAVSNKYDSTEIDHVLTTAVTMAEALEYYIIEGNIYRVVMARRAHGFERLTMSIGELLTLLNTLWTQRGQMSAKQVQELEAISMAVERTKQQLYVHFQEMVVREIMSRLDSINWFLHDCEKGKAECQANFPSEMRNRQRIEELVKALGDEMSPDVAERVERIDQRLRQVTHRVDFIWSEEAQHTYPENPYWYLYSLPNE